MPIHEYIISNYMKQLLLLSLNSISNWKFCYLKLITSSSIHNWLYSWFNLEENWSENKIVLFLQIFSGHDIYYTIENYTFFKDIAIFFSELQKQVSLFLVQPGTKYKCQNNPLSIIRNMYVNKYECTLKIIRLKDWNICSRTITVAFWGSWPYFQ